jgi:FkbM family methyltransferase
MSNILRRRLSKMPAYVRQFGMLRGLRLLMRIERALPVRSKRVERYRLAGYPAPIHLRNSIADHATFWQCLVLRQYDTSGFPQHRRLAAVYREAVERGERPLIIDCGANIGLASAWFALSFPRAQIYAIEPDLANFELLRRNVARFADRITPVHGAVWYEQTDLRIINPDSGSAAFRISPGASKSGAAIPGHTIDEICSKAKTDAPLIVKIDIEGAQSQLFSANTGWVGRTHLIAIELDDWQLPWQGTSRPFFSEVSRYPFDYLLRGEIIFCFRDVQTSGDASRQAKPNYATHDAARGPTDRGPTTSQRSPRRA